MNAWMLPLLLTAGEPITLSGDGWQAAVAPDGCLTSLTAGGSEFFKSAAGFPRGAYLYRDGLLKAPDLTQPAPGAVTAVGEGAESRFAAAADHLAWTLVNHGEKPLSGVIVFDPAVKVALGDDGRWRHLPTNQPWHTVTLFAGRANLRIEGGGRVWGPWGDGLEVWQVDVGANSSATITFRPLAATAAQVEQALAFAAAPPPPPPSDPVGPMWNLAELGAPPATFPAEGFADGEVKGLYFAGPPYEGKPTRVFAWVGFPPAAAGDKVPGIVLVHGGGGTAFSNWVKRWNDYGYAAIAMDTCGCIPRGTYGNWQRQPDGGPPGWGGMDQIDDPRTDQWTYHAVADAILAHSLLRSLPRVDPDRIGLTGISWGGYLACILAGVDPRLKFDVPVYGCGFTNEHGFAGSVAALGKERGARWMRWWDPSAYLAAAKLPMLWVTGTNDFAYTFNALQKSYRLAPGPHTLAIRLRMPHGHGPAGEGPKEIPVFADSIVAGKPPLARITGAGRDGRQVWATFESAVPVRHVDLMATCDQGAWQNRLWKVYPAEREGGRVTATLPAGATVWYINLTDERDCVVSSEHEELPAK
jgi:dienelactone hydrolase